MTAIVTDPDGIDDLIGGQLLHADGSGTYGAFATAAQEGAYQISVPFNAVADVVELEGFTPLEAELVAEFFDQAGNAVQASVFVELVCGSGLACSNDNRCMAADNECSPLLDGSCPGEERCNYNDSQHHYRCNNYLGTGTQGDDCPSTLECADGFACRFGSCAQWCDLDAPVCPSGTMCIPTPSGQGEICGNEGNCG